MVVASISFLFVIHNEFLYLYYVNWGNAKLKLIFFSFFLALLLPSWEIQLYTIDIWSLNNGHKNNGLILWPTFFYSVTFDMKMFSVYRFCDIKDCIWVRSFKMADTKKIVEIFQKKSHKILQNSCASSEGNKATIINKMKNFIDFIDEVLIQT